MRKARKLVKHVADEEGAAQREVDGAFAELRANLITRLVIGTLLTVPPALMFLGMGPHEELGFDVSSADVFQPPYHLPTWTQDAVPSWKCGDDGVYFPRMLNHCTDEGLCMTGFLVALRGKRPFEVHVRGARDGAAVQLDRRNTEMLDMSWKRVALEAAKPAGTTFVPPVTGWYRVLVVAEHRTRLQVCGIDRTEAPLPRRRAPRAAGPRGHRTRASRSRGCSLRGHRSEDRRPLRGTAGSALRPRPRAGGAR